MHLLKTLFLLGLEDYYLNFMVFGLMHTALGRGGGLMVSALYSRSSGLSLSPGQGTALCSWAKDTLVYYPCDRLAFHSVPFRKRGG